MSESTTSLWYHISDGQRRRRWGTTVLIWLAVASGACWLATFLISSLASPAYGPALLFLLVTSGSGTIIGLFVLAKRRREIVSRAGLCFLAAAVSTMFVLSHTTIAILEGQRAFRAAHCMLRLRDLGRAVQIYQANNKGKIPESLEAIEPYGRHTPRTCPNTGKQYDLDVRTILETGVIAPTAQTCSHDSYWFRPLLLSHFRSNVHLDPSTFTTDELLDVWIHQEYGNTRSGPSKVSFPPDFP